MDIQLTILGSGTSQGIPVLGCDCEVCTSKDKHDNRLRSSALIEVGGQQILIDTGPDLRQQLLANDITNIDAILITHEHNDHVIGLDDIRPINHIQGKDIPLYAEANVMEALESKFPYIFQKTYPGGPSVNKHIVTMTDFKVNDITITPLRIQHGRLDILGFKIDKLAYITDASAIPSETLVKLQNIDTLVINALRITDHPTHFNLEQALEIIERLSPRQTILTHISHQLGLHEEVSLGLPDNVALAFDNMKISV